MPGIGSFGRFMIPFGSTMGSSLNTFNSYGQQQLKNRLEQQRMQLDQQKEMLDQQRYRLEAARQQHDFMHDAYTQNQQKQGYQALASAYAQAGQQQSDPWKRRGYDALANAAMQQVPDEMMKEIAATYGLTPADVKDALAQAETFEHTENARYMQGVNRTAGYEPPAGAGGGGGGGGGVGASGIMVSPDGTRIWKDGKEYPAPWATGGGGRTP